MLLIVSNQLATISKRHHIYIFILLLIMKCIHNIIAFVLCKPFCHLSYPLLSDSSIMQQTLPYLDVCVLGLLLPVVH